MDEHTNLSGMSPSAAREYLLAHMTDLKGIQKEITAMEADAAKWKNRADLAAGRGIEELKAAAEGQEAEIRAKLANLRLEESDLASSIQTMKAQLPGLAARERTVDADLLLAELQLALDQLEPLRAGAGTGYVPPQAPEGPGIPERTQNAGNPSMGGQAPGDPPNPDPSGGTPQARRSLSELDKALKETEAEKELEDLKNKMKG